MAEAAVAAPVATPKGRTCSLACSACVFSPRATYAAIVARPRVLGAFVITIGIMAATQGLFFATPVMQEVLLDQQVRMIESFGVEISDQMYTQHRAGRRARALHRRRFRSPILIPIVSAIIAAIILGVWGMLLGGAGTFKQVYAILGALRDHHRAPDPAHDAAQLRHRSARRRHAGRVRADGRGNVVHRAVPGRHRPVLDLVVRQRRHRRGRAVQAEDRRHRDDVPRDLRVCGPVLGIVRSGT